MVSCTPLWPLHSDCIRQSCTSVTSTELYNSVLHTSVTAACTVVFCTLLWPLHSECIRLSCTSVIAAQWVLHPSVSHIFDSYRATQWRHAHVCDRCTVTASGVRLKLPMKRKRWWLEVASFLWFYCKYHYFGDLVFTYMLRRISGLFFYAQTNNFMCQNNVYLYFNFCAKSDD